MNSNREISKQEPLINIAQSQATVQFIAAQSGADAATRYSYQTQSQTTRTTLINAYDVAWDLFYMQTIQSVTGRSSTTQSLKPLNDHLQMLCNTLQDSLDAAVRDARNDNNNMIGEAAAALTTIRRYQAQCFQTVQLWLNVRRFDIALSQIDAVLSNTLTNLNIQERNSLAFHAASTRYQISIGSSGTKSADLLVVDQALAGFSPNSTSTAIAASVATIRAAYQLRVNDLVNPTTSFPEAVLAIANDYCKVAEEAVQRLQIDNDSQFTQAMLTISGVIGAVTPAAPGIRFS